LSWGYSNGELRPTGRFTTDGRSERRIRDDLATRAAMDLDRQLTDVEVRGMYEMLVGSNAKLFGTEYGQGLRDAEAFEKVAEEAGFSRAVRTLKNVSPKAKRLNSEYWARRARQATGRRP
jgi:hypothetical protein